VTVALSGDGGDELFAGYGRYAYARRLSRVVDRLPWPAGALVGAGVRLLPGSVWDRIGRLLPRRVRPSSLGYRLQRLADLLDEGGCDRLYRDLVSQWHDPGVLVPGVREPVEPPWTGTLARTVPDFTERMQLTDLVTYLPDDILTKVDRASMAVSLEARVPLLDHRVVELSWRLPPGLKVRGSTTKWLLRQVLYRHVPRELIERPKMGFGVPIDAWLRGPLRDWAEDLLAERRLREEGLFAPDLIRRRWADHLEGRADWHYPLWVVLTFQAWRRRWLDPH
jgi:asparagine synthase (glutamine-hydrolysing)